MLNKNEKKNKQTSSKIQAENEKRYSLKKLPDLENLADI